MAKPKTAFFVTGTDTEVGKTLISAAILQKAGARGLKTIGLKPLAAGCEETPEGLRNEDALTLQAHSSVELPYEVVNPVSLKLAIAPHIAAEQEGRALNLSRLEGLCRGALMQPYDLAIVEGAGGWRVPINQRHTLAHLAQSLGFKVILVVGLRLGCINHALLSAEAIRADGLEIAGWVVNQVQPEMAYSEANISSIEQRIMAPCIGKLPYLGATATVVDAAQYIDLDVLI
ncbi:MAG: dethiobiotin synthase [Pseudohongiellaceae bacterium]|nr:dethiobiotin synthase [Pseudohongiellaceae bacterium]